ncbi:MAG: hypothetical protein GY842_02200 [bacterium]|nr:hypothetical protein [bacterium]
MKKARVLRQAALLASGIGLLFQVGCTTATFLDFLNTVLLGVTAAGSVAILQNI